LADTSCIFCRIVKGDLPAYKLYEDEHCLVILDVNPIASGHSLIISKEHYPTILDTPVNILAHITQTIQKVIPGILKGTNAEGFNIMQNNGRCASQIVPHLHFHIIPRVTGDNIRFNWLPRSADKSEFEAITVRIKQHIESPAT